MTAPRAKRVIVDMDVEEISPVDEPAQEPATIRAHKNRTGAAPMADKTPAQYDAEITELQASNKRLAALASMTDDEKAYHRQLDVEDRPVFLGKSATDRQAEVKAARDADPEVYEAKTGKSKGRKFRKSEQALADMAQELDEQHDSKALVVEAGRKARIETRVKSFKHLTNDKNGLAVAIDAIDRLPEGEGKEAAWKMLEAANATATGRHEVFGEDAAGITVEVTAAEAKFKERVDAFATKNKISAEEAMARAPLEDRVAMKLMNDWRVAQKAAQN